MLPFGPQLKIGLENREKSELTGWFESNLFGKYLFLISKKKKMEGDGGVPVCQEK